VSVIIEAQKNSLGELISLMARKDGFCQFFCNFVLPRGYSNL
jgi:hypothetical protein